MPAQYIPLVHGVATDGSYGSQSYQHTNQYFATLTQIAVQEIAPSLQLAMFYMN